MFDCINLKEALSDLYNCGVQDDTLNMLYKVDKSVAVRVKTQFGLTDEVTLDEVVLKRLGPHPRRQPGGYIWKGYAAKGYSFIFRYKGYIPVPLLGQIDDTIGISQAGYKAAQFNSYIYENLQINIYSLYIVNVRPL